MTVKPIVIGISGASGSGKSLLANTIVNELGSDEVVVISEDSYYKDHPDLSFDERCKLNYDHPNAFDHTLLAQHLQLLRKGNSVEVPVYDFTQHRRSTDSNIIENHVIVVIEGILLFWEETLRELMDIRIFMDTPLDICFLRRLKRDIEERERTLQSVIDQYQITVRPMYLQFIEPSKRYADVIVPRGGSNRIAIDMIQAKMKQLLSSLT